MSRATYRKCQSCGDLHNVAEWPRECLEQFRKARSSLPMPTIRSDGMDPIVNHADGQMYDSRSSYYRAVEAAGCRIVEPGMMDAKTPEPPTDDRKLEADIKTSIEQLEAGYVH